MFEIKCNTGNTLTLPELRAFQGGLKKRSGADIDALIASINEDGLLMPIAVWAYSDKNSVLDGHARMEALTKMAITDPMVLQIPLPVIYIEAASEDEARKALLQITSQYGHVTAKGLKTFTASITNYRVMAPVVIKVLNTAAKSAKTATASDDVILRLKVRKDMVKRLTEVLSGVEGVSIL